MEKFFPFKDKRDFFMLNFQMNRMTEESKLQLIDYYQVETSKGITLSRIYDKILSRSGGDQNDAPVIMLGVIMCLKVTKAESDSCQIELNPLPSGPFPVEMYEDRQKVADYVAQRYDTRVAETVAILKDVQGPVVALGDGAGVAYRAVQIINESVAHEQIVIQSFDPSFEMRRLAKKKGNVVKEMEPGEVPGDPNALLFISHVVEYLPKGFIQENLDRRMIFYEHLSSYEGCWLLVPYKVSWGYKLATRNYFLHSVSLPVEIEKIGDKAFSVLGIFSGRPPDDVIINDQMYMEIAVIERSIGNIPRGQGVVARVDKQIDSSYIADIYYTPGLGVVNSHSSGYKCVVFPLKYMMIIHKLGPYLSLNPLYCAKGKLMCNTTKVTAFSGVHSYDLAIRNEGDYNVVSVPNCSYITLQHCKCALGVSHTHLLKVINKSFVEYNNFIIDARRHFKDSKVSRGALLEFCCSRAQDGISRFQFFERLGCLVYDTSGLVLLRG